MTKSRWITLAAGTVVLVVAVGAVAFALLLRAEDKTPPRIKNFTAEEQQRKAQLIVDGLNTHEVSQVHVVRGNNTSDLNETAAQKEQDKTIQDALPGPSCRYALSSIDDRGRQGEQIVPGITKAMPIYRLDLDVQEMCPQQPPHNRLLGLLLMPYWSHWTPLSFAF